MTNKDIAVSIKDKYTRSLARSPDAVRFYAKLRDGTAKMPDVLKFSTKSSDILTGIYRDEFQRHFPSGLWMNDVIDILPEGLRKSCMDILDASRRTITVKNKNAGIGIQGLELEPDAGRIERLVRHLSENLTDGELPAETKSLIRNLANSEVDRSIRENIRFLDASGVEATVTRVYSGKGLKDGPCQWCLDREGTNVPVSEAQSRGMFARHEGCSCEIDYTTKRGTKRQTDWTRNKWTDTDETLEKRKTIGL